jgi:hypothetical protein
MNSELMPHEANNIEITTTPNRFENLVMEKRVCHKSKMERAMPFTIFVI